MRCFFVFICTFIPFLSFAEEVQIRPKMAQKLAIGLRQSPGIESPQEGVVLNERDACRNPGPSGPGKTSYLSGSSILAVGESPSLEEGALQIQPPPGETQSQELSLQPNGQLLSHLRSTSFRNSFLQSLDKMLSAIFDDKGRSYAVEPRSVEAFETRDAYLQNFDRLYGYFSEERPLVGRVTDDESDLAIALELLRKIQTAIKEPSQREITSAEVMTKLLAYRELKKGKILPLPSFDKTQPAGLVLYEVDEVIDIWRGMPAFGLVPKKKGSGVPILLFRGTDFSLVTEKGWASIISDLEVHDPGLFAFHHGQEKIHAWLQRAARGEEKARVMGFSLGGILTVYTLLYEKNLVNQQKPSLVFNPPGVSFEILQEWVQAERRAPLKLYITEGDVIPKYGKLINEAFLLSDKTLLAPLAAHTSLMTLLPEFTLQRINTLEENDKRKF